MTEAELIVVGAGPFGLIAAHTWLELNPDSNVLLLESDTEVGGTWSKNRIYPGIMTQTPVGMFEYSGHPMEKLKNTFHDYFPGDSIFTYLDTFAQVKRFAGKTVKERIKFATSVTQIARQNGAWALQTEGGVQYTCRKLIMAIGLTSTPYIPKFVDHDFESPIVHTKYLSAQVPFLFSPEVKDVVLIGGSKSSFDAAQMLIKAGKSVHWVIRTKGQGPALLVTPDAPPPLSNSHQILSLGVVSAMNPCIFEPMNAWTRFFHQSKVGMWITAFVFKMINALWQGKAKYGRSENFAKLRPDRTALWSSETLAVCNSPDFWDVLAKTTIYRDDIDYLEGTDVVLESGKRLRCDALVTCTGWDTTYPMFNAKDAVDMGLPLSISAMPSKVGKEWDDRIGAADKIIIDTFPGLANPPKFPERAQTEAPSRLYRFMVPSSTSKTDSDRSIVFLGNVATTQSMLIGEIQSLWAAAYLMGDLHVPLDEKMMEQVALATAWRRRRYLCDGHSFMNEQIQYVSMLLRDMGLNCQRKGGAWWREMFTPYVPSDYRGIVEEWKRTLVKEK